MSQNRFITAVLTIFLLMGTISIVAGATTSPINNPNDLINSSIEINTAVNDGQYNGSILGVASGVVIPLNNSRVDLAYVNSTQPNGQVVGWVPLDPNSGVQENNMLAILNSAFWNSQTLRKQVTVIIKGSNIVGVFARENRP